MKIPTISLLLLPLIQAAALPTSESSSSTSPASELTKRRWVNIAQWTATNTRTARFFGSFAPAVGPCTPGTRKTTAKYLVWPYSTHGMSSYALAHDLPVCDVTTCCDCGSWNNCPTTEDALVNRLLSAARELGWNPPLGVNEVYRGLHQLDPEVFPHPSFDSKMASVAKPSSGGGGGAPGPTQQGIKSTCNKWVVAKSGDNCWALANRGGCSIKAFYGWNPAVNKGGECSQLWVGYAYCVGRA